MQPYMDRVYVSPAAQRLDICAPFPHILYVRGPVIINRHFDMIHIHEPFRGPGFGSHDMIPWSSHDLSRGESGLPIGQ